MKRKLTIATAIVLLSAGAALAYVPKFVSSQEAGKAVSFVCPLTGDVLPCPSCCPANR